MPYGRRSRKRIRKLARAVARQLEKRQRRERLRDEANANLGFLLGDRIHSTQPKPDYSLLTPLDGPILDRIGLSGGGKAQLNRPPCRGMQAVIDIGTVSGNTAQFSGARSVSPLQSSPITTYTWIIYDGTGRPVTQGVDITHVFPEPGSYLVKLRVENQDGCYDETVIQIRIQEDGGGGGNATPPTVSTTITPPDNTRQVCRFITVAEPFDTDNPECYVTLEVDWGDSSPTEMFRTDQDALPLQVCHTYATNGTYNATLGATDSCTGLRTDTTDTVVVDVPPEPPLLVVDLDSDPNERRRIIHDVTNSLPSSGCTEPPVVSIDWGDGSPVTQVVGLGIEEHLYEDFGTYTITTTLVDACTGLLDINTETVVLQPLGPPSSNVTFEDGPDPLQVIVDPTTSTPSPGCTQPLTVTIDFGDGTTFGPVLMDTLPPLPEHTYTAPGSYDITTTVTDGCNGGQDVTTQTRVVGGPPSSDVTIQPGEPDDPLTTIVDPTTSTPSSGCTQPLTVTIDWGDGTTFGPVLMDTLPPLPEHTYTAPGSYDITTTVTDACTGLSDTTTETNVVSDIQPSFECSFVPVPPPIRDGLNIPEQPAFYEFQITDTTSTSGSITVTNVDISVESASGNIQNFQNVTPGGTVTAQFLNGPGRTDYVNTTSGNATLQVTLTSTDSLGVTRTITQESCPAPRVEARLFITSLNGITRNGTPTGTIRPDQSAFSVYQWEWRDESRFSDLTTEIIDTRWLTVTGGPSQAGIDVIQKSFDTNVHPDAFSPRLNPLPAIVQTYLMAYETGSTIGNNGGDPNAATQTAPPDTWTLAQNTGDYNVKFTVVDEETGVFDVLDMIFSFPSCQDSTPLNVLSHTLTLETPTDPNFPLILGRPDIYYIRTDVVVRDTQLPSATGDTTYWLNMHDFKQTNITDPAQLPEQIRANNPDQGRGPNYLGYYDPGGSLTETGWKHITNPASIGPDTSFPETSRHIQPPGSSDTFTITKRYGPFRMVDGTQYTLWANVRRDGLNSTNLGDAYGCIGLPGSFTVEAPPPEPPTAITNLTVPDPNDPATILLDPTPSLPSPFCNEPLTVFIDWGDGTTYGPGPMDVIQSVLP